MIGFIQGSIQEPFILKATLIFPIGIHYACFPRLFVAYIATIIARQYFQ
jgi:hypothetical protein